MTDRQTDRPTEIYIYRQNPHWQRVWWLVLCKYEYAHVFSKSNISPVIIQSIMNALHFKKTDTGHTINHLHLPSGYLLQVVYRMSYHRCRHRCTCLRHAHPRHWWWVFGTHPHSWSRTSCWVWSPSYSCTTSPLHWCVKLGIQGDHDAYTSLSYPWVSSQTWRAALQ